MTLNDRKLALFFDKDLLQQTADACVQKGHQPSENRVELAKQMAAGQYHIAPPHIIEIPKRDSAEMRKVYCNEPVDRFICAQIGRVYDMMFGGWIHPNRVSYQRGIGVGRIVQEISGFTIRISQPVPQILYTASILIPGRWLIF